MRGLFDPSSVKRKYYECTTKQCGDGGLWNSSQRKSVDS
jgi:hypothetical protein